MGTLLQGWREGLRLEDSFLKMHCLTAQHSTFREVLPSNSCKQWALRDLYMDVQDVYKSKRLEITEMPIDAEMESWACTDITVRQN